MSYPKSSICQVQLYTVAYPGHLPQAVTPEPWTLTRPGYLPWIHILDTYPGYAPWIFTLDTYPGQMISARSQYFSSVAPWQSTLPSQTRCTGKQ